MKGHRTMPDRDLVILLRGNRAINNETNPDRSLDDAPIDLPYRPFLFNVQKRAGRRGFLHHNASPEDRISQKEHLLTDIIPFTNPF